MNRFLSRMVDTLCGTLQRAVATLLLLSTSWVATAQEIQLAEPQPIVTIAIEDLELNTQFHVPPPSQPLIVSGCGIDIACPIDPVLNNAVITPADGWAPRIITAVGAPQSYIQLATDGVARRMGELGFAVGSTTVGANDSGFKRFVMSRRNEARAAAFLAMINSIATPPYQRTATEQQALAYLATLLKAKRIAAAEYAVKEHQKWTGNPCAYLPPAGFSYAPGRACSDSGTLGDLVTFGYPIPTSFDAFGAALAFPELSTPQGTAALMNAAQYLSARSAQFAVAAAASAAFAKIAPELGAKLRESAMPLQLWKPALSVKWSLRLFAGPVGIVLSTVADIVFASLDLAKAERLGPELQRGLARANNATIDLAAEIQTGKGIQQLFSILLATSLFNGPDPAAVYPLPGSDALDLKLTTGSVVENLKMIPYRSWDGSKWRFSLSPTGWFVHGGLEATSGHTDAAIHYMDWNNVQVAATYDPSKRLFRVTQMDGSQPVLTNSLEITLANFAKSRLSVTPLATPSLSVFYTSDFPAGAYSPIFVNMPTSLIYYVTPNGQPWTARRSGSLFIHQPRNGGGSHTDDEISVQLLDRPEGTPVAANCSIRPAGSPTAFRCQPWNTSLPARDTDFVWFVVDSTKSQVLKLQP